MEDTLYKFLSIYKKMPLPVRNFIGMVYDMIPVQLRYGSFYSEYMKRLKFFNTVVDLSSMQQAQLKLIANTLNHAIDNIPYYRDYHSIKSIDDFRKLPIIDKKEIICKYDDFIDASRLNECIKGNTGGSSGTPLSFNIHRNRTRPKEKAHFDWYWGQFGYTARSPMLMVRGAPLANNALFEYQAIGNKLSISCYEINDSNIDRVIDEIKRFKPMFIHAYPSSLRILTSYIGKPSMLGSTVDIKAVFLGSEYLFPDDRILFGEFYNAYIVNWYGHSESLVHGGNCPFTEEYHFYPAYGFLELLDDNGENITIPDTEGRIVCTGFDNEVMPFIRYDTEDRGVLSINQSCQCGFVGTSIKKIVGRGKDHILLADGTQVSLTAFIYGQHFAEFGKIVEMQLQQDERGKLLVRIVKGKDFNQVDEESLTKMMLSSVSGKLSILFEYVESIPKTHRGKHRFLIQDDLET